MTSTDKPRLNPALRSFWETQGVRNRVLYGGRASSKSWDAAGMAIAQAQYFTKKFLCTRQFQNRIEDSVYTLLIAQIERFGLKKQFDIQKNVIRNVRTGSEFVFYGLWRSIDEIKSIEGIDIHWSEEAHLMTEKQWEILDPTIRKQGSEHWMIFNPRLATDFVYKRFVVNPPPDTLVRKINYDENPFLSETMLKIIEKTKQDDPEKFRHVYLGEPMADDERSVIKRSWLMAAIDAHKKLGIEVSGSRRIGFDVADAGEDACAMVQARGQLAEAVESWQAKEDELIKSATRVWHKARETSSEVVYDAIGVGAGVGAKLKELGGVQYQKFLAGGQVFRPDDKYEGVKNRDFFANIKAQAWWLVADRLRNTYNAVVNGENIDPANMIFLSSDIQNIEPLIDELSTPLRDFDAAGRVKVESKKDLAKRDIASPNLADAFIMAFIPQIMVSPKLAISQSAIQKALGVV